jgi:spore germination cell wall hydrolase CwlJ-like protein
LALVGVLVPTNPFVYATTSTNNVEKVSSLIDVDTVETNLEDDASELKNGLNNVVDIDLADLTDTDTSSSDEYSLVIGEELATFNTVFITKDDEETVSEKFSDLSEISASEASDYTVVKILDEATLEAREEEKKAEAERIRLAELQQDAMVQISNPDGEYEGHVINLSDSDRDLVERLIMGESGGIDLTASCLVAQSIRDAMYYKGYSSIQQVRTEMAYSGSITKEPNEYVKQAVKIIFDNGGYVVRHKVLYFYAPKLVSSSWHESRDFIIEYGGHRYFS